MRRRERVVTQHVRSPCSLTSNIGKSMIQRNACSVSGLRARRATSAWRTRSSAGLDTRSGPATDSSERRRRARRAARAPVAPRNFATGPSHASPFASPHSSPPAPASLASASGSSTCFRRGVTRPPRHANPRTRPPAFNASATKGAVSMPMSFVSVGNLECRSAGRACRRRTAPSRRRTSSARNGAWTFTPPSSQMRRRAPLDEVEHIVLARRTTPRCRSA